MISNRTRAVARVVGGLAMLALVALCWAGCSSAPVSEGVGTEESAIRCNQDDCTGNPPGRPPCGIVDNACCAGSACHDGSVCDNTNTCVPPGSCGSPSFPCCASNSCTGGVACTSGNTCGVCGNANQPCCSNAGCNSSTLTCLTAGTSHTCVTCGHEGEACCHGTTCNGGLYCGSDKKCAKPQCGYFGGPCCPDPFPSNQCPVTPGLACDTTFQRCEPCGGAGQICCPGLFPSDPGRCTFSFNVCGSDKHCH